MNSDETEPDMSALFNDFRSRKDLLSASGRMRGNDPGNRALAPALARRIPPGRPRPARAPVCIDGSNLH